MGDGRFYAPTQPKPYVNKKRLEEIDRIFQEALAEARKKKARK